jgi:hypothetical protein
LADDARETGPRGLPEWSVMAMEHRRGSQATRPSYRELTPLQCLAPYLACVWVRDTDATDLRARVA